MLKSCIATLGSENFKRFASGFVDCLRHTTISRQELNQLMQ